MSSEDVNLSSQFEENDNNEGSAVPLAFDGMFGMEHECFVKDSGGPLPYGPDAFRDRIADYIRTELSKHLPPFFYCLITLNGELAFTHTIS